MWTKQELKKQLQQYVQEKKIAKWALTEDRECKREYYLIRGREDSDQSVEVDQERSVEGKTLHLSIYIPGKSDKVHGKASGDLSAFESLEPQLETLLNLAGSAEEKYWDFKDTENSASTSSVPKLSSIESSQELSVLGAALQDDLVKAISQENQASFNSAELFCIYNETRRELSSGFENFEKRSKIYSEACFSYKNDQNQQEDEYLVTQAGVHPEQISFDKLIEASAQGSKNLTHGILPKAGDYTVMIDSKVLVYLFTDVLSHLHGASEYYKMPFSKEGEDFIENYCGEGFELRLNPAVDYATASGVFDNFGMKQSPLSLIKNNKVLNHIVDSRMSQYLNKPATSSFGVVEILPETTYSDEDLYKNEKQVLEIHQFSGLFTSADDLTFSSEIRLGKLIDVESGEFTWVRGGSLSGNFKENFVKPKWSSQTVTENLYDTFIASSATYKGPEKAIIHNVSISS